jgi:hypothetical protein
MRRNPIFVGAALEPPSPVFVENKGGLKAALTKPRARKPFLHAFKPII